MFLERKMLGVYAANCYILGCNGSKEAIVIDPGGESEEIIKILDENGFKLKHILLTHGHGDHIGAVNDLLEKYDIDVIIHKDDSELLDDPEKNLSAMMPGGPVIINKFKEVQDNDIIEFGNKQTKIIHTPGHTRGCICILIDDYLFTGDTLFKGSIGRTDLYGGGDDIIDSIKKKIYPMEEKIKVLSGHGAVSTIYDEKRSNSFLIQISETI